MIDLASTKYNHEIFSNQCKNALDIAPGCKTPFAPTGGIVMMSR